MTLRDQRRNRYRFRRHRRRLLRRRGYDYDVFRRRRHPPFVGRTMGEDRYRRGVGSGISRWGNDHNNNNNSRRPKKEREQVGRGRLLIRKGAGLQLYCRNINMLFYDRSTVPVRYHRYFTIRNKRNDLIILVVKEW